MYGSRYVRTNIFKSSNTIDLRTLFIKFGRVNRVIHNLNAVNILRDDDIYEIREDFKL